MRLDTVSLSSSESSIHTHDSDDILQFLITLQHSLYRTCYLIMLFAYCLRRQDTAGRIQRIYCRVNTWLAISRESTVVASRWVNVVAGAGSVKSSAGTYTACTDVIEPFLVEVIRSCKAPISVASVGWYLLLKAYAKQCRNLRTSLGETEDVIDEQQHVLILNITEVFCHSQSGKGNSHTCARRLVHLTIY